MQQIEFNMQLDFWKNLDEMKFFNVEWKGCKVCGCKEGEKWRMGIFGRKLELEEVRTFAKEFLPPFAKMSLNLNTTDGFYYLTEN